MLRAVYLPANQAWAVLFGDALTSVDGRFLFTSCDDLDWTLRLVGLTRTASNHIVIGGSDDVPSDSLVC